MSCDIQVSVVLLSSEIYNLSPSDIEMQFSCTGRKDGVEYDYQEEVNNSFHDADDGEHKKIMIQIF